MPGSGIGCTSKTLVNEAESPAVSVKRSVRAIDDVVATAIDSWIGMPKEALPSERLPKPDTLVGSSKRVRTVAPSISAS